MASDIYVSFGGDTAPLEGAVDRSSSAIATLGPHVASVAAEVDRSAEAMQQSLHGVGEVDFGHLFGELKQLAAAFGVAFGVDKIKDWTVAAIDAADKVSSQAAKTGFSTGQVQVLGGLETLAGSSDLIDGLSKLETNLRAITDGTDETSQALKVLGLTANQLKGQLPTTQLEIIAAATAKFGDGATKTAALTKLLGSAAEGMIRTLDEGAAGVQRLEDATQSAGAVIDAGITQALARTAEHIRELNQAWTSGAGTIVGVVNPAIDAVIVKLTQLLDSLTADQIRTAVVQVSDAIITVMEKLAEFAVFAKAKIDELIGSIGNFDKSGFLAAVVETLNQLTGQAGPAVKYVQDRLKGLDEAGGAAMGSLSAAAKNTADQIAGIEKAAEKARAALHDLLGANTPLLLGEYAGQGQEKPGHALPQVPAMESADKEKDKTDRDAIEAEMIAIRQLIDDYGELARAKIKSADDALAHQRISVQQWLAATKTRSRTKSRTSRPPMPRSSRSSG